MNKIYNYQEEWGKIKQEQKIWRDKYNKSNSPKMKYKYCSEIMRYETALLELKEKYENVQPTKG